MASEFEKNSTNMYVEQSPQGLENGQVQKNVDDDGREIRTGTVLTASAHIITAVIGSGVLSLAWAMAQLGWVAGIVILFLFSFITYFTSTLLADCYRSPGPVAGKRNYSYMEVVRSHLGGIKVQLCGISQYGNLVGITIGYTITASISMVAVVRSNCFHKKGHQANCTVSNYPYMAVFAVLQIILSQIPNFHKLSWLSILAAVMSFAYSLIGLGLSIAKDTLRSPPAENKAMKRASLVGVFTTTLFYVLCGTIGYAAFGNNAPGNFLTGFGFYEPFWLIDIANVCIAIHLIGAYQVINPIVVRRNSSYDELVVRVLQNGDLDCVSGDMVISYLMHSRKNVNHMIINSDIHVLMYMMDIDADGFRPILRINVVERSFEGLVNSSEPLSSRPIVNDDFSDYENDGNHPINMEDDSMHMEDVSSDS
ncbi:Amino acid permease 1 [Capsicum baccatum]|uniref:Amino acid permease 1 n=1 Tax=Capsicum baccatum TaxID=33114 RepID=A0A2G2VHF4_CAPBA|nr:Amino acid permease 1 [Capsicum baccatum]